MGQLEGCQKIPKKISEVRREVIWWSKRYNWHKTIEKSCLSFTVWPHERSTFEEKKWHKKAIFPVLQKLTHMSVCDWQQNSITKDNLFCQVLTLVCSCHPHTPRSHPRSIRVSYIITAQSYFPNILSEISEENWKTYGNHCEDHGILGCNDPKIKGSQDELILGSPYPSRRWS